MENLVYKWFCKDYYSDSIKVQVINDFGDGTALCQPMFSHSNGDEIATGEKMVVETKRLFDEPMALIRISEKDEEIKKKKEKLENDFEIFESALKGKINALKDRAKWLQRVEKEAHPEKVKEVLRLMYMLIEAKDLYLFEPTYNSFKWYCFNMLDPYNPLFVKGLPDCYRLRLISLYPDTDYDLQEQVQFCFNEYPDDSGYKTPFKMFNDKQKFIDYVQKYVSNMELNQNIIDKCTDLGIEIPKERLLDMYKKQLNQSIDMRDDATRSLQSANESISKLESLINELQ